MSCCCGQRQKSPDQQNQTKIKKQTDKQQQLSVSYVGSNRLPKSDMKYTFKDKKTILRSSQSQSNLFQKNLQQNTTLSQSRMLQRNRLSKMSLNKKQYEVQDEYNRLKQRLSFLKLKYHQQQKMLNNIRVTIDQLEAQEQEKNQRKNY